MEFEEMQIIWNEENNEKLFAINEAALYKQIKRKSRSVSHLLNFFEWVMVGSNLAAAVILLVDALAEGGPAYQYLISAVYLAYSLIALFLRARRRQTEGRFAETMVGELDKALSQLNYHIRQAQSIGLWYVLPLAVVVGVSFALNDKVLWALASLLVLLPISILGPRWEINKWYLPKKRELEALRETLLADEARPNL